MIYIRNISNKIIHIGEIMLLPAPPDDRVLDEKKDGTRISDSPIVQKFLDKGLLELVDVRPAVKKPVAKKREIKVEYEEGAASDEAGDPVSEVPEKSVPETPVVSAPEGTQEEKGADAEKGESVEKEKPKAATTRRRRTQPQK